MKSFLLLNVGFTSGYYMTCKNGIIYSLLICGFFFTQKSVLKAQNWEIVNEIDSTDVYSLTLNQSGLFAVTASKIFVSIDNGNTWQSTKTNPDDSKTFNTIFSWGDYLYLGTLGNGVFRSGDGGESWESYSNGLSGFAKQIYGFAEFGDTLYAATNGAGVYMTAPYYSDGWVAHNNGLFQAGVNSIAVSGEHLVACTGQYLFIKHRNSNQWIDIYPDTTYLQLQMYEALVLDQYLFVGTENGIYRGNLEGTNWQKADISMFPNQDIFALARIGSMLVAGLIYHNEHWIFTSEDMGNNWEIRAHEFAWLWDLHTAGNRIWAGRTDGLWYFNTDLWTGIETDTRDSHAGFELFQAYPNPFNPETNIHFVLPKNGSSNININLNVFNLIGQKIATLHSGPLFPGEVTIKWDGKNDHGLLQPSGIYFVQLQSGQFEQSQKIMLVR